MTLGLTACDAPDSEEPVFEFSWEQEPEVILQQMYDWYDEGLEPEMIPYRTTRDAPVCGKEQVSQDNAFYCDDPHSIIWDEHLFKFITDEYGPQGVWLILAHEYGHAQQWDLRGGPPVEFELDADCRAGGILAGMEEDGLIVITPEDIEVFLGSFDWLGVNVANVSEGQHGTERERRDQFLMGYEKGLKACARR